MAQRPPPDGAGRGPREAGPPARPRGGRALTSTREDLLDAAERLFAERGVDAVSLREVNRESGARNAVAVQYHFTDRAGVLAAVLARYAPAVDEARNALLDEFEAEDTGDLRLLAGALVRPLAAQLATEGGRAFLRIHADLVGRIRTEPDAVPSYDTSVDRWRAVVGEHLDTDATRLHRRFTAMEYAAVELGRRAHTGPHTDDRLFVSHVVDVVAAILGAPVSAETSRLMKERDATVRPHGIVRGEAGRGDRRRDRDGPGAGGPARRGRR